MQSSCCPVEGSRVVHVAFRVFVMWISWVNVASSTEPRIEIEIEGCGGEFAGKKLYFYPVVPYYGLELVQKYLYQIKNFDILMAEDESVSVIRVGVSKLVVG